MVFTILDQFKDAGCFVRKQFHIYCPGCGGTRALEALLRLHPMQSLYDNPVVILMLLAAVSIAVIKIMEHRQNGQRICRVRTIVSVSFLSIWFLFFAVRNMLLLCCGIDMLGDFS
jgi:hypothetical protein